MFHSAAVKLTIWYLGIIIVLSLGFSIAIFRVSGNEFRENAARQVGYFRGILGPNNANEFAQLRQRQLDQDLSHLRSNLVLFNTLVLIGGGVASYALARRTLRPIETALEIQSRFSADASHELRTPLTVMQTENEVALRNPQLTKAEALDLLKSNLEEVGRLKILSDGLLSLAHANAGDREAFSKTDLSEIINKAAERVTKSANLKKVKITQPKSPSNKLFINCDSQKLTDLVAILLDNAVKYSPRGGQVNVAVRHRSKKIEILVSDQGQGINPEDMPHIFDRFYRAENSRSKNVTEGYGLGLAIAKQIVEQHHGTIEVKSAPGKGSTFTIKLPSTKIDKT